MQNRKQHTVSTFFSCQSVEVAILHTTCYQITSPAKQKITCTHEPMPLPEYHAALCMHGRTRWFLPLEQPHDYMNHAIAALRHPSHSRHDEAVRASPAVKLLTSTRIVLSDAARMIRAPLCVRSYLSTDFCDIDHVNAT